jgi:hypothetical protein
VRGKLRDKRSNLKQERIKRELLERRRPPKRDSRISIMHMQQLEEDYQIDDEEAQLVSAKKNK